MDCYEHGNYLLLHGLEHAKMAFLYCVLHQDGDNSPLNPVWQRVTPSRLLVVVFSKRLVFWCSSVTVVSER